MERDKFYEYQSEIIIDSYINFYTFNFLKNRIHHKIDNEVFWIKLYNYSISNFIINWCKLFGNYNSNQSHWQTICSAQQKDEFQRKILLRLNMSKEEWERYHKSMLDYRNKFFAHSDFELNEPLPYLDKAFQCIRIYEMWIKGKILTEDDIIYFDDLNKYIHVYKEQLRAVFYGQIKN